MFLHWRRFARCAAVLSSILIFSVSAAPAKAQDTIVFDDHVGPGNPALTELFVGPWLFEAQQFHSVSLPGAGVLGLVDGGSPYIASIGGGLDYPITMRRRDGLPFSLVAFDAGEGFLDDEAAQLEGFASAASLSVMGTLSGGGDVTASFAFDGSRDGSGGTADFQSFDLPAEFSGLVSVTFSGRPAAGDAAAAFALDNIVVTAIPEPSMAALAAAGIISLVLRAARRRTNIRPDRRAG